MKTLIIVASSFGGILLFLPAAEVRRLALSVEDGLKLVISGGIAVPPAKPGE